MPPKRAAGTVAPMDDLYFRLYREHAATAKQVAILLLVGKFYEMYDSITATTCVTNVRAAAEACGCAAEPRPTTNPGTQRIFWGFPEQSLAKFERMLVAAGYTVAVYTQTKDSSGAVTARPLEHISSPGTYLDPEERATSQTDRHLLGLCLEPYRDVVKGQTHWYGAATAFDVTTGCLVSTEFDLTLVDGRPCADSIQPFLSAHPAIEVVLWWSGAAAAMPSEAVILALVAPMGARPLVQRFAVDATTENTAMADRQRMTFLQEIFQPKTALSLDAFLEIERHPFVRRSLSHLLRFIKKHNESYLSSLPTHRIWASDEACVLGNLALQQLAMLPATAEKPHESLLHWLQRATTAMGRRALRERCLTPLTDIAVLEFRQERIEQLRTTALRKDLQARLTGVSDLPRLIRRFQLGTAGTKELKQLLRSYDAIRGLMDCVGTAGLPFEDDMDALKAHAVSLKLTWSLERIEASEAVVDDRIAVGICHPWNRGVQPALDACEDRWATLQRRMEALRQSWNEALEESEAVTWSLKDDAPFTFSCTNRRAKILQPLIQRKHGIPVEIVQRGTQTTVSLMTESLQAANAEALALRAEWKVLVGEAWIATWSAWLLAQSGVLGQMVTFVAELDVDCGLAEAAELYGYVRPVYVESTETAVAGVQIAALRHPILERVHTATPYIPHSVSFGALRGEGAHTDCGMLLYGVNAAGKSSLGKAVGLAVVMAQIGMPVPATAMRLIPYTGLYTRILGNDNLWLAMSSFVVEMTEFRSILRGATNRTLVIGDELCAGTETESAVAIVGAGIQVLAKRGVHFLFATHLHELGEYSGVKSYHLSVRAQGSALLYDRLLKEGAGSAMYGLEVCRGLDMDREFLALAFQLREERVGLAMKASRYNAGVVVSRCSLCGATDGLETHHIVPQREFKESELEKNRISNLAVLCAACHDKHHAGSLTVGGWVQTSEGRVLL